MRGYKSLHRSDVDTTILHDAVLIGDPDSLRFVVSDHKYSSFVTCANWSRTPSITKRGGLSFPEAFPTTQ